MRQSTTWREVTRRGAHRDPRGHHPTPIRDRSVTDRECARCGVRALRLPRTGHSVRLVFGIGSLSLRSADHPVVAS
ncbi:hypothetical protein GCM10018963_24580 [Saccharothrix longispora]